MTRCSRGFTLVELMIVVLLMGLMLGFAVPALRKLGASNNLKGAKENVIAQVQLARAKAIATGVEQQVHFLASTDWDYHIHLTTKQWKFPKGVSYGAGSPNVYWKMQPNGRVDISPIGSNMIPLVNQQGLRDTVMILSSGLVVSQ